MSELETFRNETRDWLQENCPVSMRRRLDPGEALGGGSKRRSHNPDAYLWLERMVDRGWTAPTWPTENGGADWIMIIFLSCWKNYNA